MTEYLEEREVPIDPQIATALFYGIASETQNLGRETKSTDIMASQFLYPYIPMSISGCSARLQYPPLPRDYFRLIGHALQNAAVYEDVVITLLEEVFYPDAVAEVADFLLRLDVARWSACLAP